MSQWAHYSKPDPELPTLLESWSKISDGFKSLDILERRRTVENIMKFVLEHVDYPSELSAKHLGK